MSKLLNAIGGFTLLATMCFVFVGCTSAARTNTLSALEFAPSAHTTATLADLVVSDRKVVGQASGLPSLRRALEQEAIANALQGNADALVGANFFYETKGTRAERNQNMTIVVIGYPAVFKNFRTPKSEDIWLFGKQEAAR